MPCGTFINSASYFAISNRKTFFAQRLEQCLLYIVLVSLFALCLGRFGFCSHNIGFTRNGEVKLFDFGLCRELPSTCADRENCGGNTSSNEMFVMSGVGTRRYMACEIINTGRYNLKADVYSWAMIFWEILNLRKPYAPYSTEDHRREVCHGGERPHIQPEWPNWIQSILRMSWEDTVEYRFSMDEVYENLRVAMCHQWEHCDAADVPSRKVVLNSRYPDDQPGSPTAVCDSIDSEFYLTLPQLAQLRSASLSYDSELQIEVEECLTAIEVQRRWSAVGPVRRKHI
jgi:serine/threonine protein kinase